MRPLLLPIESSRESDALNAINLHAGVAGMDEPERIAHFVALASDWRQGLGLDRRFQKSVKEALLCGFGDHAEIMAKNYFSLHRRLSSRPLMNQQLASAFLSHGRFAVRAALVDRMSPGAIANLLRGIDARLPIGFRETQILLRPFGAKMELTSADVLELFEADSAKDEEFFADAQPLEAIRQLDEIGTELGFRMSLGIQLLALTPTSGDWHAPYLQMLHFMCTPVEYLDSSIGEPYEFKPRGEVSRSLLEKYPDSMRVAESPFLNNAKSAGRLDRNWAAAKQSNAAAAHALVSIVDGLEEMGYLARHQLASWIRAWLCRVIRLEGEKTIALPERFNKQQITAVASKVVPANTNTRGVLEQRLLDAIASTRFQGEDWVDRGLGDSVNASNTSRLKCGDCEFQSASSKKVEAFEAHGGTLTAIYVDAHVRSLVPILRRRKPEWFDVLGTDEGWRLHVRFVAHAIHPSLEISRFDQSIEGVEVRFSATTFEDEWESARSASGDQLDSAMNTYFLARVSDRATPTRVKEMVLSFI